MNNNKHEVPGVVGDIDPSAIDDTVNRFHVRNSSPGLYVAIRGIFDITGEYLAREIASINSDVASR